MAVDSLNPAQRQAVLATQGPVLVLAGAGSGKTRVITHRVALLLQLGVPPDSIVAITFTNKAAEEMRHRLRAMVGKKQAEALVMGTFHALGARMMRQEPADFDVPKRFSILDQGDVLGLVRSLLREHGLQSVSSDRRFDPQAVAQRIGLWKNEFHSHAKVEAWLKAGELNDYDRAAAQIYASYDDRLRSLGSLDFDDLVCRVALCLEQRPAVKERWTTRFQYVLVDEYQDTNPAQMAMVRGMLGPQENLCVVGDDDQAIYGWRGAKVANILAFDMFFPAVKVVKLVENYRCRPAIVACANQVIQNNRSRYDKELVAQRHGKEPVWVVACADDTQETKWVGQKIRRLIRDKNVDPGDIAVLYRSSRQVKPIEGQLKEHAIAYQILGGQPFYDRKEVKDVTAYLKVLVTPHDDLAVRRALDVPHRGVGAKTIERLSAWATERNTHLLDAVLAGKSMAGLAFHAQEALGVFGSLVLRARDKVNGGEKASQVLRFIVEDIHLRDNIHKETGSAEATTARWSNVEWLFGALERFEARSAKPSMQRWQELFARLEQPKDQDEDDKLEGVVTLSTFHSAKGLEWPYVFIVGCEEGIMPHKRVEAPRINDAIAGDIEEERRLFYVGITRARDELYLTRAKMRVDRGREVECLPSRFLTELPSAHLKVHDVQSQEKLTPQAMDDLANAFLAKLAGTEPPPASGSA